MGACALLLLLPCAGVGGTARPMEPSTRWVLLDRQKLRKAVSKEPGDLSKSFVSGPQVGVPLLLLLLAAIIRDQPAEHDGWLPVVDSGHDAVGPLTAALW